MTTMSFMPELKEFLLKNKLIFTVRKYKMVEADVEISGVGLCRRIPLGVVTCPSDLESYTKDSGFSSVENWWFKIRHFVPDRRSPLYLYKVEVKREE